jgi:hypothetical protein
MFYNEVNFNLFLIDENVCIAIEYFPFGAFIVVDVTSITSNCRFYVYNPIVLVSCFDIFKSVFVIINTAG